MVLDVLIEAVIIYLPTESTDVSKIDYQISDQDYETAHNW